MIRKIGLALLYTSSFLSTNLFAATEHLFTQAPSYEFILPTNEPQIFTNSFFWSIQARCTIVSEIESTPLTFTVIRKTGSLNGIPLTKGDTVELIVHPGDDIFITAASGGRVELTNHGETTITATCSNN